MLTRNMYTLGLVSAALVSQTLFATLAYGHGFMQSPQARQQFCVEDGGYWWPDDGSAIPNLACRQAFLKSGTKQFVQNHEFSTNVVDYHNQASVEAAVPNGLLCAGGDSAKQGMDEPSSFGSAVRLRLLQTVMLKWCLPRTLPITPVTGSFICLTKVMMPPLSR